MTKMSDVKSSEVMWRNFTPAELPMLDEPAWPAQAGITLPVPNPVLREASSVSEVDAFYAIGEAWAFIVTTFLPRGRSTVMDIGCGCGKLARFLALNPNVSYVGVDLFKPAIEWCNKAFKPVADRFRFVHFDGVSTVYNPEGLIQPSEYTLPADDKSVDMVVAASLFTHLFEEDAKHYLEQIERILTKRGRALISIHISPEPGSQYSGNEARIDSTVPYFTSMVEAAGLKVKQTVGVVYGQTLLLVGR